MIILSGSNKVNAQSKYFDSTLVLLKEINFVYKDSITGKLDTVNRPLTYYSGEYYSWSKEKNKWELQTSLSYQIVDFTSSPININSVNYFYLNDEYKITSLDFEGGTYFIYVGDYYGQDLKEIFKKNLRSKDKVYYMIFKIESKLNKKRQHICIKLNEAKL